VAIDKKIVTAVTIEKELKYSLMRKEYSIDKRSEGRYSRFTIDDSRYLLMKLEHSTDELSEERHSQLTTDNSRIHG
jgi:hypothetical protein